MRWPRLDSASNCSRRYGANARRILKGAVTWTSMMAYHCSSLIFWMTLSQVYPALLTMTCSPPSCLVATSTMRSPKSLAVTSPLQATARPPIPSISAIVSFAGASSRSFTTTAAPSLASRSATSRPMPRPEPVTIATLPSSCPMPWVSRPVWIRPLIPEAGGTVKRGAGDRPASRLLQKTNLTKHGGVIPVDSLAGELVAAELHDHHDVHRDLLVRRGNVRQEPRHRPIVSER